MIAAALLASALILSSLTGVQDDLARARQAEEGRDFRAALAAYERALTREPGSAAIRRRLADCRRLAAWQAPLAGRAPGAMDLVRLGELHLALGRPREERDCYRDALELDPRCGEAHGHLALWNYSGRGRLETVIAETLAFLRSSPHREKLEHAIRDFDVHGHLRLLNRYVGRELVQAREMAAEDRTREAAAMLEAAARRELPDAIRTTVLVEAGQYRMAVEDWEGARASFARALDHADCPATIDARIAMAALAVRAGEHSQALAHLRAAVAEGSLACAKIAADREFALAPLFASEDAVLRDEVERLADTRHADEPIRAAIRAALGRAGRENTLVLLHFYGPFCPWVMALEERLAHPELRAFIAQRFPYLRIDLGSMHRARSIDADYGGIFTLDGVPSFHLLAPDGSLYQVLKPTAEIMDVPGRSFGVEKLEAKLLAILAEWRDRDQGSR